MGDRGGGYTVFQDEVPPDDPSHEFAECGIRVGVGGTRDRYHRRKLCIAQGSEYTRRAGDHERYDQRGPRLVVSCNPDKNENTGTDDGAHAQRRERYGTQNPVQAVFAHHLLVEKRHRLSCKQVFHMQHLFLLNGYFSASWEYIEPAARTFPAKAFPGTVDQPVRLYTEGTSLATDLHLSWEPRAGEDRGHYTYSIFENGNIY